MGSEDGFARGLTFDLACLGTFGSAFLHASAFLQISKLLPEQVDDGPDLREKLRGAFLTCSATLRISILRLARRLDERTKHARDRSLLRTNYIIDVRLPLL